MRRRASATRKRHSRPQLRHKDGRPGNCSCSAAKTASIHNVDNRIMFSAGLSALSLGWLEAATLPMEYRSAAGKSVYFDGRFNKRIESKALAD